MHNTTVSDAMVEAAIDAWENVYEAELQLGSLAYTDNKEVAMRAAIDAALAPSVAKPCGVKALEWEEGGYGCACKAETAFGTYEIYLARDGYRPVYFNKELATPEPYPMGIPAAKAAAQADFERRILSCLSHPAQGWREDAVERAVRAWAYEEYYLAGGGVGSWHEKLSFNKPKDGRLDIRSIAPLYVAPPEGGVAQDLLAAIKQLMPSNLGSLPATMPDSATLPLDVTFGELRQAIAAIAKAEGRQP